MWFLPVFLRNTECHRAAYLLLYLLSWYFMLAESEIKGKARRKKQANKPYSIKVCLIGNEQYHFAKSDLNNLWRDTFAFSTNFCGNEKYLCLSPKPEAFMEFIQFQHETAMWKSLIMNAKWITAFLVPITGNASIALFLQAFWGGVRECGWLAPHRCTSMHDNNHLEFEKAAIFALFCSFHQPITNPPTDGLSSTWTLAFRQAFPFIVTFGMYPATRAGANRGEREARRHSWCFCSKAVTP